MNARADIRMTRDQFLAWAASEPDQRAEWVDGDVVMMVSVRRVHNRIVLNALSALSRRLSPEAWDIRFSEFALDLVQSLRVPDVFVEPAGANPKATFGNDAVFIIEVLSPSTIKADMIQKPREYGRLKSLEAYLVLSTDERTAFFWQRRADGSFPDEPIEGTSGTIDVAGLGVSIPLEEFYVGVSFG